MQSQAVRLTRVLGTLALLGGFTAAALAQDPVVTDGNLTLSLPSIEAAPGQTVSVPLSLSGGVANTSAVNFTVKISAGANLVDGAITGTGAVAGYEYEDNTTSSGEYRGVLYPSSTNPAAFSSTDPVVIANLTLKIKDDAADGGSITLDIVNEFDGDGTTGLVGVSNSAGSTVINKAETVAANGVREIKAVDGKIVVADFTTIEFNKETFNEGWEAAQFIPFSRTYLPTASGDAAQQISFAHAPGTGVVATADVLNGVSFGVFQTTSTNFIKDDVVAAGNILVQNWAVASTATNPNDTPTIRARSAADGWTELTLVQEPVTAVSGTSQGFSTVPVAGSPTTVQHLTNAVPSASNGGETADRDGFLISIDLLTEVFGDFKLGAAGTNVTITEAELRTFDPSTLSGGSEVYNQTFAGGNTGGFAPSDGGANGAGVAGQPLAADAADGLLLTPSGAPTASSLSFGWFENAALGWTANASNLYRVDFNISTTAPTPLQTNISRLRFAIEETPTLADYVKQVVIESGGPSADLSNLPSTTGTDYTTYVRFPAGLDNQNVKVFFDAYQTGSEFNGQPITGGVKLNSLKVTAYPAPSILD